METDREKKRIAQFLIEDVTLIRDHSITAHVRFKGGATRTLSLPLARSAPDLRRTRAEIVERIDQLLNHHTEAEVVELLNAEGDRTGTGLPFTRARRCDLRVRHNLKNRYDRLRDRGLWTLAWSLQPSSGGTLLVCSRPTRADRTVLSGSMNLQA